MNVQANETRRTVHPERTPAPTSNKSEYRSAENREPNTRTPSPTDEVDKGRLPDGQIVRQQSKQNTMNSRRKHPKPLPKPENIRQESRTNNEELTAKKKKTQYRSQGASNENTEANNIKDGDTAAESLTINATAYSRHTLEENLSHSRLTEAINKQGIFQEESIEAEDIYEKVTQILPENLQNCETFFQKIEKDNLITHRFITEDEYGDKVQRGTFNVHFKLDEENGEISHFANEHINHTSNNNPIEISKLQAYIGNLCKQIDKKRNTILKTSGYMQKANESRQPNSPETQRDLYNQLVKELESYLSAFRENIGGAAEYTSYRNTGNSLIAECIINTIEADGNITPQILTIKVDPTDIS